MQTAVWHCAWWHPPHVGDLGCRRDGLGDLRLARQRLRHGVPALTRVRRAPQVQPPHQPPVPRPTTKSVDIITRGADVLLASSLLQTQTRCMKPRMSSNKRREEGYHDQHHCHEAWGNCDESGAHVSGEGLVPPPLAEESSAASRSSSW